MCLILWLRSGVLQWRGLTLIILRFLICFFLLKQLWRRLMVVKKKKGFSVCRGLRQEAALKRRILVYHRAFERLVVWGHQQWNGKLLQQQFFLETGRFPPTVAQPPLHWTVLTFFSSLFFPSYPHKAQMLHVSYAAFHVSCNPSTSDGLFVLAWKKKKQKKKETHPHVCCCCCWAHPLSARCVFMVINHSGGFKNKK